MAKRSPRTRGRRWRPEASACARCWSCSAPGRAEARPLFAGRPRSSSSTWRPWSMTTCWTRRRSAADTRRWSPAPGRDRALAVGDLLFSRAFAELGSGWQPATGGASLQGIGGAGARRAGPAARRLRRRDLRGAIPGALRAEDGPPVRVRLRDRAAGRLRAPGGGPWRSTRRARGLRSRDRPRLSAPRRRARRHGPAGADGQGPRDRPVGRHRDPALDPRPRARSAPGRPGSASSSAPTGAEAVCDRIAATGVLDQVRAGARRRVELAKRALERSALEPDQRRLLELVADGVVERYS